MPVYEKIEWTNTWVEEQGREDSRRVLLVGDSISNGARARAKEALGEGILLDMLATSHALDDPAFRTELDYILGQNRYDAIHFNNGLHGFHLAADEYERLYEETVRHIRKVCPGSRLILALSTPITKPEIPEELDPKNTVVLARNEAVRRIAERLSLPVNDLYGEVSGRPELRSADGYHYGEAGYAVLGGAVARAVKA